MKRICASCSNGMGWPELVQTGWSGTHAEWICPACKKEYWEDDGNLTSERPFKWPAKERTTT